MLSFSLSELEVLRSALRTYMDEVQRAIAIDRNDPEKFAKTIEDLERCWGTARAMFETIDFVLHDQADEVYLVEHHGIIDSTLLGEGS